MYCFKKTKILTFVIAMLVLTAMFLPTAAMAAEDSDSESTSSGESAMLEAAIAATSTAAAKTVTILGEPSVPQSVADISNRDGWRAYFAEKAKEMDKAELNARMPECTKGENSAHQMAENARALGFGEDNYIIKTASQLWWRYRIEKNACRDRIKEIEEEARAAEEAKKAEQFEEDLDLLSKLIWREVGNCPDWVQQYAASVVLNRIADSRYPDNMYDVIFQDGQYGPAISGTIWSAEPDARTIENCRYILQNGSVLPAGVIGQNGSGRTAYAVYYNPTGWDVYFTY